MRPSSATNQSGPPHPWPAPPLPHLNPGQQVLYLDVRRDAGLEQLTRLAAATRAHFQQEGLLLQAGQAFLAHVTVAKTSKLQGFSQNRRGGGRGRPGHRREWWVIPAEAWAQHAAIAGGRAVLGEVQLCAMQGRKPQQYYQVLCSLPLAGRTQEAGGEAAVQAASGVSQLVPAWESASGKDAGGPSRSAS